MFCVFFFFFFNDTATTEISPLSLHDALPISVIAGSSDGTVMPAVCLSGGSPGRGGPAGAPALGDRKSTRLNSSHGYISYAVFCLKKKKKRPHMTSTSLPAWCHYCAPPRMP